VRLRPMFLDGPTVAPRVWCCYAHGEAAASPVRSGRLLLFFGGELLQAAVRTPNRLDFGLRLPDVATCSHLLLPRGRCLARARPRYGTGATEQPRDLGRTRHLLSFVKGDTWPIGVIQ